VDRAQPLNREPAVHPSRDELYGEFQPLVRRLLRQYGETPEVREELAGELYLRFSDLLNSFDPNRGVPLRAYLVRTLTAAAYTFARSHWRRQKREVSLEPETNAEDIAPSVDPTSDWDRQLMMEGVLSKLPEVIARLPQRQRQVVVWRYYESRSFEEIAEVLGIQVATARSLLRHGLNNLRKEMAGAE
jgi:RNA polymerase sigma-70 factor (ECF subfamily)